MSKEETKNNETNGVRSKLLGKPGWWDAGGVVNAYEEVKGQKPHMETARVLAQTAYFARHEAAKVLTERYGQPVHPEHVTVWVSPDQTDHGPPPVFQKKVNGVKRKRK